MALPDTTGSSLKISVKTDMNNPEMKQKLVHAKKHERGIVRI